MRRSFGGTVLLGLASAALVTVAASHTWVSHEVKPAELGLVGSDLGKVPLAAAVGYLLLASWGVLLVTRGRVRRFFALVGLVATVGLAVCVGYGITRLPHEVKDTFSASTYVVTTSYTGWLWAALVGVVVSLVATLTAAAFAPTWPAMGRRYDAPGSETAKPAVDARDPDADNRELWKAIDEGQDPTDPD